MARGCSYRSVTDQFHKVGECLTCLVTRRSNSGERMGSDHSSMLMAHRFKRRMWLLGFHGPASSWSVSSRVIHGPIVTGGDRSQSAASRQRNSRKPCASGRQLCGSRYDRLGSTRAGQGRTGSLYPRGNWWRRSPRTTRGQRRWRGAHRAERGGQGTIADAPANMHLWPGRGLSPDTASSGRLPCEV